MERKSIYMLYKLIPVYPQAITFREAACALNITSAHLLSLVYSISSDAPICEDDRTLSYIDEGKKMEFLKKAYCRLSRSARVSYGE